MGFGLLFLGYVFMFSFPYHGIDLLPDIIGVVITYIGVCKLSSYGFGFPNLKKYYLVVFPASIAEFTIQILQYFNIIQAEILDYYNLVYSAVLMMYNILLLLSIAKAGKETESLTIYAKSKRNLYLAVVYYSVIILFNLPLGFIQQLKFLLESYYFGLVMLLFGYIWMILNLSLIFSCYMWICDENDVDMLSKKEKKLLNESKNKKEE